MVETRYNAIPAVGEGRDSVPDTISLSIHPSDIPRISAIITPQASENKENVAKNVPIVKISSGAAELRLSKIENGAVDVGKNTNDVPTITESAIPKAMKEAAQDTVSVEKSTSKTEMIREYASLPEISVRRQMLSIK